MRRGTFREGTVDYAAVGATHAPDLMQYPPEQSLPAEESWRLGSGEERFRTAGDALLSWTAQRAAGLQLAEVPPCVEPRLRRRELRRGGCADRSQPDRGGAALRRGRHAVGGAGHDA